MKSVFFTFAILLFLQACVPGPDTAVSPTPLAATATALPQATPMATAAPTAIFAPEPTGTATTGPVHSLKGLTTAVTIVDDKAYTAVGPSLVILDISNPNQPVRVGHLTLPAIEEETLYPDWIRIADIAVNNNYAYLAATDGIWIVDVSDPSAPVQLGLYETVEPATAVAVFDKYVLVTAAIFSDQKGGFRVIDVSDPAAPKMVGAYKQAAGYTDDLVVHGNTAYLTAGYGLRILDISNPFAPVEIGHSDISGHQLAVLDQSLYLADWEIGLRVLDVSNPARPVETGSLRIEGAPQGIWVNNQIALVANGSGGLILADVTSQPVAIGTFQFGSIRNVVVSGKHAFLVTAEGLVVVDLTDPELPQVIGLMPPDGRFLPGVTAVPTPLPSPIPNASADPLVIAPENIDRLTQLAQIGNGRIDSITWLPDGQTFAVGSSQGVHLYDSGTLEQIQSIQDSLIDGSVHLRYSPSGSFLLITMGGYETDRVTLWDAHSGTFLRDIYDAFYADFSSEEEVVYFEWTSQQLIWHDPASGETRQTVPLPFTPRAFSLASGTIVELYLDKTLRLYDIAGLALQHTIELPNIVDDVAFSPEGDLIAAASRDGAIRLWNVQSGALRHTFTGQPEWVSKLQFSPDGRLLATWSAGAEVIRLWDIATGQMLHEFPVARGCSSAGTLAFSPDGQELATVDGGSIHFFDVVSGATRRTLENDYCYATDLAFRPDRPALYVAGTDHLHILDIASELALQVVPGEPTLSALAFSQDGSLLAKGHAAEPLVEVQNGVNDQLLFTLETAGHPLTALLFSPDGRLLATQSEVAHRQMVEVWDVTSGKHLASFPVYRFAFRPDGRYLAFSLIQTESEPAAIALWDTTTFQVVQRLEQLELVGFGPEGALLAAQQNAEGQLLLAWWDSDRGELLQPFNRAEGPSRILSASPDGRLLLGFDNAMGTLGIWDTATEQRVWGGHFARTAAFSGDGRFLATVSTDGVVQLWGLPTDR